MGVKCFMLDPTTDAEGTIIEWVRRDTGEKFKRKGEAPPGAMYYMPWIEELLDREVYAKRYHRGPDGRVLGVQTPGGPWIIDSRCSNCTLPDDDKHACWVRSGEPPHITVGKNGTTCAAGAGSIICGSYHGFLRNGEFT